MTDNVTEMRIVRSVRPKLKRKPVAAAPADGNVVKLPRKMPVRKKNTEYRSREYMIETEIKALTDAIKDNRNAHRDATMILTCWRHGFRVSELVDLRWDQIIFPRAVMHVRRLKNGSPSVQPIMGDELRMLRRLQREQEESRHGKSPFVFVSERGSPFHPKGFAMMLKRAAERAGIPFKAHPHMLRHTTGFVLANKGHDTRALQGYLGHKNIQHTVVYTALADDRFKDIWR